jgi:hypothetical protein
MLLDVHVLHLSFGPRIKQVYKAVQFTMFSYLSTGALCGATKVDENFM